jgi:hypothetical protein
LAVGGFAAARSVKLELNAPMHRHLAVYQIIRIEHDTSWSIIQSCDRYPNFFHALYRTQLPKAHRRPKAGLYCISSPDDSIRPAWSRLARACERSNVTRWQDSNWGKLDRGSSRLFKHAAVCTCKQSRLCFALACPCPSLPLQYHL